MCSAKVIFPKTLLRSSWLCGSKFFCIILKNKYHHLQIYTVEPLIFDHKRTGTWLEHTKSQRSDYSPPIVRGAKNLIYKNYNTYISRKTKILNKWRDKVLLTAIMKVLLYWLMISRWKHCSKSCKVGVQQSSRAGVGNAKVGYEGLYCRSQNLSYRVQPLWLH